MDFQRIWMHSNGCSMDSNRFQRIFSEIQWSSMDSPRTAMDSNRFQLVPMDVMDFQWIPMIPMDFQWISMDYNEFPMMPLNLIYNMPRTGIFKQMDAKCGKKNRPVKQPWEHAKNVENHRFPAIMHQRGGFFSPPKSYGYAKTLKILGKTNGFRRDGPWPALVEKRNRAAECPARGRNHWKSLWNPVLLAARNRRIIVAPACGKKTKPEFSVHLTGDLIPRHVIWNAFFPTGREKRIGRKKKVGLQGQDPEGVPSNSAWQRGR